MILGHAIGLWKQGQLADSILASIYFFVKAKEKDPSLLARKTAKDIKIESAQLDVILPRCMESNNGLELSELLKTQRMKRYSGRVGDSLQNWLEQKWDLELCDYVPSADMVLARQCQGVRPVTVILDPDHWGKPIGHHTDELDFLVHDLEHAANFHKDPLWKKSQILFFRDLTRIISLLDPLLKADRFRSKFEYLVSDMNSHVLHLMLYLRASILEHFDNRELYFRTLESIADALEYTEQVRDCFLNFEKRPRLEAAELLTGHYENAPYPS